MNVNLLFDIPLEFWLVTFGLPIFEERKEKSLSGVAVFGHNLKDSYYIENPFVEEGSKILGKEISALGYRWVKD